MFNSTEQAINILQNTNLSETEREEPVQYLKENPSEEGIQALITGLEDDDFGVRWACGAALAELGEQGLKPLLKALAQPNSSARLREGARHVLDYNSSSKVRIHRGELIRALKGSATGVSSMEAAHNLLHKLSV